MKKIVVEDNIMCKVYGTSREEDLKIYEKLSYGSSYSKPKLNDKGKRIYGRNGKPVFERVQSESSYYNRTTKRFLTGFLPKVLKIGKFKVEDLRDKNKIKFSDSNIEGFEDRDYQTEIVNLCLEKEKGCIEASTGIGKTLIMLRIIKALKDNCKILVLCHDKDTQFKNYELGKELFNAYWVKSGTDKGWYDEKIVFSMIQTFKKHATIENYNEFDVILVDEIHRVSETYKQVFMSLNARFKLGFTGTFPKKGERALLIEGLFGPILKKIKNKQIEDMGKIVPIKIELYSPKEIQFQSLLNRGSKFQKIYEDCIVNNENRNRLIKRIAKKKSKKGLSTAIFTTRIDHAKNLDELFKGKVPVLTGDTPIKKRNEIRKKLDSKKIMIVIVNIWKEGVDIPSLDCCINAFGFKAGETTLQVPGRAVRPSPGKEFGILVDFLDPWKHLSWHSVQRLRYYKGKGWL